MNRLPILTKSVLFAGALAASCGSLLAGSPRVNFTYPAGGQRGAEGEITCSGGNLEDAKGVLFDEPGFESTLVTAEKGKFKVKVKVGAQVRLGEHSFRVVTSSGLADVRLFYVTPFPMVEEQEIKEQPDKAQPVALGTTVYGRTQGEDQDKFEVELKKGQRLSAEVIGARLQTQSIYDPFLTISKADGTMLKEVDDGAFTRQDPVASIIAPEDGKYLVTVKDSTNSGPGECHYLLSIGSYPRPVAVYPAGGPMGTDLKVKLIGDASGVIEQSVKLPNKADDRFELFPQQDGQTAPQPNYMRVSPFPNVLESEPNNDPSLAVAVGADKMVPAAFNGIIQDKGDVDCFKFEAKKGQDYDVTVYARRLRSPLDSVLSIYDAKGNRLAQNDDSGGPDSYLRWKAPADGDFVLGINDQLMRGGPAFTYRIEVTPVQPRIATWLPEMTQNQNQDRRAFVVPKGNRYASLVRVKRQDVGGEIQLEAAGLPAGIKVSAPNVDKSVDTIPMVFEAAPETASAVTMFPINARLTEPPKDASVVSTVENEVDVAENGNQKSFYSIKEDRLPVEVIDEIPVKISLVQPKVPVLQSGAINLKVVAERKNDFKGPISLALLYSPPGTGTSGSAQIKENETEAVVTVSANGNAALQKWKICVVGNADFGKGPVWFSTQLIDLEVAAPFMSGKIQRSFVDQGESTTMTVSLDQKVPFEGKAKIQLLGLPPNTTAEEVEVTKDDKEAKFTVKATKDAPAASHKQLFCQFNLVRDGEQMNSSFGQGGILRIDKATVAKAEEPKK